MLTQPDERTRQAIRRLRHQDDVRVVLEWAENQRKEMYRRCAYGLEEPRLRMFQGAAQTMDDLIGMFEEER